MEPKFKVGQKVVVMDDCGSGSNPIFAKGQVLTVSKVEPIEEEGYHPAFYTFEEADPDAGLYECRLEAHVPSKSFCERANNILSYERTYVEDNEMYARMNQTPNKTAEEIAPTLWDSYSNILNEEASAALRQVIEGVENHEEIGFADSEYIGSSFHWISTEQGSRFWYDVDNGLYNKTIKTEEKIIPLERNAGGNLSLKEAIHLTGTVNTVQAGVPIPMITGEMPCWGKATPVAPVKSDGGSSGYYKISVKTSHGMVDVEVNDIIYAMVGGDFDLANVLKAARRMYLASKGCGKEGVDIAYDARKIVWFCDDFVRRFGDVNR